MYPLVCPAGDAGLTVEFGATIDPDINDRVIAFAAAVEALQLPGFIEVVPAYRCATVYFDPLQIEMGPLERGLRALAEALPRTVPTPRRIVTVPVIYGGQFGPELDALAVHARLSVEEVVALHCSVTYKVYMLGFSPGFPYMGQVPEAITVPRLPEPRAKVPAGSVGIAGAQTGIYPYESPGGWRLIGRTPLQPYDPARANPFLLDAGDAVRFRSIDRSEYERLVRISNRDSSSSSAQ